MCVLWAPSIQAGAWQCSLAFMQLTDIQGTDALAGTDFLPSCRRFRQRGRHVVRVESRDGDKLLLLVQDREDTRRPIRSVFWKLALVGNPGDRSTHCRSVSRVLSCTDPALGERTRDGTSSADDVDEVHQAGNGDANVWGCSIEFCRQDVLHTR